MSTTSCDLKTQTYIDIAHSAFASEISSLCHEINDMRTRQRKIDSDIARLSPKHIEASGCAPLVDPCSFLECLDQVEQGSREHAKFAKRMGSSVRWMNSFRAMLRERVARLDSMAGQIELRRSAGLEQVQRLNVELTALEKQLRGTGEDAAEARAEVSRAWRMHGWILRADKGGIEMEGDDGMGEGLSDSASANERRYTIIAELRGDISSLRDRIARKRTELRGSGIQLERNAAARELVAAALAGRPKPIQREISGADEGMIARLEKQMAARTKAVVMHTIRVAREGEEVEEPRRPAWLVEWDLLSARIAQLEAESERLDECFAGQARHRKRIEEKFRKLRWQDDRWGCSALVELALDNGIRRVRAEAKMRKRELAEGTRRDEEESRMETRRSSRITAAKGGRRRIQREAASPS
jgi:hypothetical protein